MKYLLFIFIRNGFDLNDFDIGKCVHDKAAFLLSISVNIFLFVVLVTSELVILIGFSSKDPFHL